MIMALLVHRAPCHSLSESGFGPTIGGDGVGIASMPPCSLAQWAATKCSSPTRATIGCIGEEPSTHAKNFGIGAPRMMLSVPKNAQWLAASWTTEGHSNFCIEARRMMSATMESLKVGHL